MFFSNFSGFQRHKLFSGLCNIKIVTWRPRMIYWRIKKVHLHDMSLCKYLRCNSIKVDGIISIFLCSSGSSPAEWTQGRRQDVLEINPIKFLYVDWLYFIYSDINQILDNQSFGLLHYIRFSPTSCFVGGTMYTSWFCNPFLLSSQAKLE